MRDYPNGGFFFIDAAPIQAAGENGLKIDGIFEDAKRAVEGGKVFVLTASLEGAIFTGVMGTVSASEGISAMLEVANQTIALTITSEDVVTIEIS